MTDRTVTAMFDTRGAVESARDELVGLGVDRTDVTIRSANGEPDAAADADEGRGFWGSLADMFMPDDDRNLYTEGLNRGGYLLSAQVPEELADEAVDALERYEPIDLDQRSERWRREGWTGSEPGASTSTTSATGLDTGTTTPPLAAATTTTATADRQASGQGERRDLGTATGEDTVQVAEEELQVGKREVGRGRLRVRSYVTERPVEEQVELRQEHVTIERRPVDRAVAPGDVAFQERTIEAVERAEEPVVSKTARVVEEIGLKKDIERETRTVRDTVRKQDVEIEDERTEQKNPL